MDFSKVKLKKTVVVDKSGPKLSGITLKWSTALIFFSILV
jgi:hypothetical protein